MELRDRINWSFTVLLEFGKDIMVQNLNWWHNKVIYQVYPRSFYDSNGDGIGDLRGIIEKVNHIVDLGVDIVWISPFFQSPQKDFGYDVTSYLDVAEEYGTLNDLYELIDLIHSKGLKVMFDLVLNHTSDQHPWFIEARKSKDNPKADWYFFADGKGADGKKVPNNWRSDLQIKSGWQWCNERHQFYFATFLPFQPDLNWRNEELRNEMFSMIQHWLKKGVDGFRLDIFGAIMKDKNLTPNQINPSLFDTSGPHLIDKKYTANTEDNFELARDLRAKCDEINPESILIGEVFAPVNVLKNYLGKDPISKKDQTTEGNSDRYFKFPGLNLVFLFDFLAFRYSAEFFRKKIQKYELKFPHPLQPTYVFENHDRARLMGRVNNNIQKAKNLALLQLTLRGVVTVYQGQEIAMENTYIPLKKALDPIAGKYFYWIPEPINKLIKERLNRDEVRTPMQWDDTKNAGFSSSDTTWLPVNTNYKTTNVKVETDVPDSVLNLYKKLLQVRKTNSAFKGSLEIVNCDQKDILMYQRESKDQKILVCLNFSNEIKEVNYEVKEILFSNHELNTAEAKCLKLQPNSGVICVD